MRLTIPAWVGHHDPTAENNQKRPPLYTVHVHPDGSRLATGGMDAKIRIWSTRPILNSASEESGKPPKLLCTLSMHTGPVLTVRWAHSGRWLASGSDDTVVMIWDLDPSGGGKVWGSENVEGWKPLKRLPGHESDVTDLAWSPGDRYLASVGLDSAIMIWCGYTLERLQRITLHQGFVKGVCWDPVGEFMATQSDDRSVKIWRTTDWSLEAEVTKPFEDSPGSTFFRRLSWSPDGAHITASNATNNKGFVFIAAVIARNSWTSEISLVGHENTVEVAAYNPHIFLRNPEQPLTTSNICSVVALGADDLSVSVWQTKSARPIFVAKRMFSRSIMDLSWSPDGLTLYAVSSDGTLGCMAFTPEELAGRAPTSAQAQYLRKFGFTPPPLPPGFVHPQDGANGTHDGPPTPVPAPAPRPQQEVVNKLVAKRKPKRGALASVPSAAVPGAARPPASAALSVSAQRPASAAAGHAKGGAGVTTDGFGFDEPMEQDPPPPALARRGAPVSEYARAGEFGDEGAQGADVRIDALDTHSPARGRREDARPARARTLGGDRVRESITVRELVTGGPAGGSIVSAGGYSARPQVMLDAPPILSYVSSKGPGDMLFEAKNEEAGPSEICLMRGKQTEWLDYLPAPVTALVATGGFCAAASNDGGVSIYSHTGRKLLPTLSLGEPLAYFAGADNALMGITTSGMLHAWNIKCAKAFFTPTSIGPLLSPNSTLTSASVRPNGALVLVTSAGAAYTYDANLGSFAQLSAAWWAGGSEAWTARTRTNTMGVLASLESDLAAAAPPADVNTARPSWWSAALTLGHLESRMHASRALDSPNEYKQALLVYAQRIAKEGFRAKAEELVRELFGPIYWRPGRGDSWSPTVLGLNKRDLLKEVLSIFARSKTLTKLALDWQDTMKKVAAEE